jgi:hypothetical protein
MYRTPQRTETPSDDIERIEISRYTQLWRGFALVLGIAMIAPAVPVAVLGLAEHVLTVAVCAGMGVVVLVMTFTMLGEVVAVEANYTRGELSVIPSSGPQRLLSFSDIERVESESISDSELMRVTLQTSSGPVRVLDGMKVDDAVRRIEAMCQKAERLAEADARQREEERKATHRKR